MKLKSLNSQIKQETFETNLGFIWLMFFTPQIYKEMEDIAPTFVPSWHSLDCFLLFKNFL